MSETDTGYGKMEIAGKRVDVDLSVKNIVKVTDRGGHSLHYELIDGVYYVPIIKTKFIKERRSFELRPDDIYFPGYLRTGTHWTFEMASMLLNGKAETIQRFKDHLELLSPEDFSKLPSPRIINSHLKLSDAQNDLRLKKVKIMYTLRDPKDVAVSLYNLYYNRPAHGGPYTGSFGAFLQLFIAGTIDNNGIFEHWRDAETFFDGNPDIPVHFQKYEDTIKEKHTASPALEGLGKSFFPNISRAGKAVCFSCETNVCRHRMLNAEDPVKSVQTLSDFLGLQRSDDLCKAIADKCEFSRMKVDKEDYAYKSDGENLFYRKGITGDWRNYFTDDMLDDYYRVYDEKLAGSRFYELYTRDKD